MKKPDIFTWQKTGHFYMALTFHKYHVAMIFKICYPLYEEIEGGTT